jgi:hypothetical protein
VLLSQSVLAEVNRWVGVLIAVFGTVVVSPSGARLLWGSATGWLRKRQSQARGQLARFLPFLRRHGQVHVTDAAAAADLLAVSTLTATGGVWPENASVDDRIEALRQHIADVEQQLNQVAQRLGEEASTRERAVAELQSALQHETAQLRRLLEEQERQSARIDARGLPVIAAGIFLSGVPDELASIPHGIGWLFPVLGVGFAVAAAVPLASARKKGSARGSAVSGQNDGTAS